MHAIEHVRQGGHSYHIEIWYYKGIPSMCVYLSGIQRKPYMVHLAGGLYTSFILLVTLFIYVLTYGFHLNGFTYSVMMLGCIQFFYGYYEMIYNHLIGSDVDSYMMGHYILYFV